MCSSDLPYGEQIVLSSKMLAPLTIPSICMSVLMEHGFPKAGQCASLNGDETS